MAKPKRQAAGAETLMGQLHKAIIRGELDTVKDLVHQGVSLDKGFGSGDLPPLHYAITEGKTEIVKFLIQSEADVNLKVTDRQKTPLMLAANEGKLNVFEALLTAGADIHAADALGWTALDTAASYEGSVAGPMIEALIAAGAAVDRFSKTWGTPLIKACWRGHSSACRVLAARGADVNVITANGTPLLQAIDNKRAEVVSALLAAGADPTLRYTWADVHGGNKELLGKTPLELARERKLKKILALLENSSSAADEVTRREATAADIPELWRKLKKVLAKVAPAHRKSLAKPAKAQQLTKVATVIGLPLPDDFTASYLIHNGQTGSARGLYNPDEPLDAPYYLMPLEEIVETWTLWKQLVDGGEFRGQESAPDDGIRPDWWHPGWVPFMSNGGGDSVCVDLSPTSTGVVGQVIHMSHEAARRQLLARSFAEFLRLLIEKWEDQPEGSRED